MKAIHRRLLIIIGIFLIAIVISGYFLYQSYSNLNKELIQRSSLVLSRVVEESLKNVADKNLESLTTREKRDLRNLMNAMTTETGSIIHILLINTNMKILLSSDRSVEGREYTSSEELANLKGDVPLVLTKMWDDTTRVLDVIIPLKDEEEEIFSYLRLVLSHRELVSFYKDLSIIFLPFAAIAALLLFFTFYFVSQTYARPLENLRAAAKSINEGDYSKGIPIKGSDEYTDTFKLLNETIKKVDVLSEGYKKTEKHIANMLQVVDESIVLLDARGKVVGNNEAAQKLLRCPKDQVFSRYFEMIKSSSRELSDAISFACNEGKVIENQEMVIWLPNGQDMHFRISSQISKEGNQITGILITFKDLNLFRELEHNLQRSMQFGVIANLASSISHELKNPLGALIMHADVISNRIKSMPIAAEEKLEKSLYVLRSEVKRINKIFMQFLNLARAKPVELTLLRINAVVSDVLLLVQQQAIERNIQLKAELDDTIDFIYGDPDQLKQVILNIVLNAFQAIDKKGSVIIRTRAEHKRIFVDVSDTGKGMSPEEQQRLFDLYYSTKEGGAGIGLAISKNIMQMHDGRISFKSAIGKGTIFTLDFPRKDQTTQTNIPVLNQN